MVTVRNSAGLELDSVRRENYTVIIFVRTKLNQLLGAERNTKRNYKMERWQYARESKRTNERVQHEQVHGSLCDTGYWLVSTPTISPTTRRVVWLCAEYGGGCPLFIDFFSLYLARHRRGRGYEPNSRSRISTRTFHSSADTMNVPTSTTTTTTTNRSLLVVGR